MKKITFSILILCVVLLSMIIYNLFFKTHYLSYDYETYAFQKIKYLKISYSDKINGQKNEILIHEPNKIKNIFNFLNSIPLKHITGNEDKYIQHADKWYILIQIFNDQNDIGWLEICDVYLLRSVDGRLFKVKNCNHNLLTELKDLV